MDLLVDSADELGEAPVWLSDRQTLAWVDLARPRVHTWSETAGHHSSPVPLEPPLGAVFPGADGTLRIGCGAAVYAIDTESGAVSEPRVVLDDAADENINDAKVDRQGRLWLATAHRDETDPVGGVYRVPGDAAGPERVERVASGFVVANGPAFSVSGDLCYVSDSMGSRILEYRVTPDGRLADGRVLLRLDEDEGFPDGITVDSEGGLWVAHWGGGMISRYAPGGGLSERVTVPAPQVTSLTFGGPDLDRLYITTARLDLDAGQMERAPLSGGVFVHHPGVRGVAERGAR